MSTGWGLAPWGVSPWGGVEGATSIVLEPVATNAEGHIAGAFERLAAQFKEGAWNFTEIVPVSVALIPTLPAAPVMHVVDLSTTDHVTAALDRLPHQYR